MTDQDETDKAFRPLGEELTSSQRRMVQIPEERQQTHALQHIARVLDRIDAKLDALLKQRDGSA